MRDRLIRYGLAALGVFLLGWFAYANMGQSVDLRFGLFTLHDVSVPVIVYGAVILGMLIMLAVELRAVPGIGPESRPAKVTPSAPSDSPGEDEAVLEEADKAQAAE